MSAAALREACGLLSCVPGGAAPAGLLRALTTGADLATIADVLRHPEVQ